MTKPKARRSIRRLKQKSYRVKGINWKDSGYHPFKPNTRAVLKRMDRKECEEHGWA